MDQAETIWTKQRNTIPSYIACQQKNAYNQYNMKEVCYVTLETFSNS